MIFPDWIVIWLAVAGGCAIILGIHRAGTHQHINERRDWSKWLEAAKATSVDYTRSPIFNQASKPAAALPKVSAFREWLLAEAAEAHVTIEVERCPGAHHFSLSLLAQSGPCATFAKWSASGAKPI